MANDVIHDDVEPILQITNDYEVQMPNIQHRFKSLFSIFSGVEITIFIYFLALGILLPGQQHFIYNRICLYRYGSVKTCDNIDKDDSLKVEEAEVQREFATYSALQLSFLNGLSIVVTILFGTWCDRFSFRLPLCIPHLGTAIGTALFVVFYFLPVGATHPIILSLPSIVYGLTGASPTEIMAAFAYVSRISESDSRTLRVAAVEAALGLGSTSGYLISALALKRSNVLLAFIVQICCSIYACVFVLSIVPKIHHNSFRHAAVEYTNGSIVRLLFYPGKKVIEGFKISWRRFETSFSNGLRRFNFLFSILLTICFFVTSGVSSITYSYVTKQPISLPRSYYALFQALISGLASFNLLVTLRCFRLQLPPWLPLSDVAIGCIGVSSRIVAYIFMACSDYYPIYAPWIYPVLSMGSGFFVTSLRSLMSKLVDVSEKGSLFAFVGILESVSSALSALIYNNIYAACLPTDGSDVIPVLRGLVFFLSAGICLPPLLIFLWILCTGQVEQLLICQHSLSANNAVNDGSSSVHGRLVGEEVAIENESPSGEVRENRGESMASTSTGDCLPANASDSRFISLHKIS